MGEQFGPVEMPPSAWGQEDLRRAVQERDMAGILRLIQKYAGVSQVRLASATGITQGRINEIINGRRSVVGLDVFERIADGLSMPDEIRVIMGLAPASAALLGAFAGHAEIAQVFRRQAEAEADMRKQVSGAASLDLMAVRALRLISFNDSLLRLPLRDRSDQVTVRVLLLDPDAEASAIRAREIGEPADSFQDGIRLSISRLRDLAGLPSVQLKIALYSDLPTWRIIRADSVLYLSSFSNWAEGHRSGVYKLTAAANGVLHAGFARHFEDVWQRSRHVLEGSA